jgi:hypothetical protein
VASSVHSKLTALQVDVLDAFFRRERGFFLTGGAALAGFYLGHRTTDDLDLFTPHQPAFERGRFILVDVAAAIGGQLQARQDAPGFQRWVLTRGAEGSSRRSRFPTASCCRVASRRASCARTSPS